MYDSGTQFFGVSAMLFPALETTESPRYNAFQASDIAIAPDPQVAPRWLSDRVISIGAWSATVLGYEIKVQSRMSVR